MKLSRALLVLLLTIGGMWIPSIAQQAYAKFSNRLIAGSYSFYCTGTFVAPGTTQPLPIAMLGVAYGDEHGNWHGRDTLSINGNPILQQYLTTDPSLGGVPATVHSDGSGTIKYQVYTDDPGTTSDATYLGELPINFVIMNNGNEIAGLPTAQAYAVACHLVRQRPTD